MKNKIEEMIYWADMNWYNFRDTALNRLARWCMKHCCIDFPTTTMAMSRMTNLELRNTADQIITWRKNHPEKNFGEIC